MDLVVSLINDPEKRLQTLKEVNTRIIGKSDSVMVGNMKKLLIALRQCLIPFENVGRSELEKI
jgi:hypothetical protein